MAEETIVRECTEWTVSDLAAIKKALGITEA